MVIKMSIAKPPERKKSVGCERSSVSPNFAFWILDIHPFSIFETKFFS